MGEDEVLFSGRRKGFRWSLEVGVDSMLGRCLEGVSYEEIVRVGRRTIVGVGPSSGLRTGSQRSTM